MDGIDVGFLSKTKCLPADDVRCIIARWLWRIVPISLLVVGTIGNVLNVAVLRRPALRTTQTNILSLLSLFDILFLWTSIPRATFWRIFEIEDTAVTAQMIRFSVWTSTVSGAAAFWTVAVFTIQRLSVVFFPLKNKIHLSLKSGYITALTVLICQSIYSGFMIYGYRHFGFDVPEREISNGTEIDDAGCELVSRDFLGSCWLWNRILVIFSIAVPLAVAFLGNAALMFKYCCCKPRTFQHSRPDYQTNMLLAIAGCLFVTMVAFAILIMMQRQAVAGRIGDALPTLELLRAVSNIVLWCNFSLQFYLYIWKGTVFRDEYKLMWRQIKARFV